MRCPDCPVPTGRRCVCEDAPNGLCARPDHRAQAYRVAMTPELLPLVAACPHRGPVLPVSRQPECGCAELSECRAGRGRTSGEVTLEECLACAAG